MKFAQLFVAVLSSAAAADRLVTITRCAGSCDSQGVWYTDYGGAFHVDANDGCHQSPGPTGMQKLCVDWNYKRLNADFDPPGGKHCLRKGQDTWVDDLVVATWDEVPCDW